MSFSIGVPVTRVEFLRETLLSIARQTLSPCEVIVIDNGADGNVAQIVRESGLAHVRFVKRAVRLPVIENWNLLLKMVKGRWFILLSDDDWLETNHLENLAKVIATHGSCTVAHVRVRMVGANGQSLGLSPLAPDWESAIDFIWHRVSGFRTQFISDFAWETSALTTSGGFPDLPAAWGSDDLAAFTLARQGGVVYSPLVSLNYRRHGNSLTGSAGIALKKAGVDELIRRISLLLPSCPIADQDQALLAQQILNCLPDMRRRMLAHVLALSTRYALTRYFLSESWGAFDTRLILKTISLRHAAKSTQYKLQT